MNGVRVGVERMESELSEDERNLLARKEFVSKLEGSCSTLAFEWEERERF